MLIITLWVELVSTGINVEAKIECRREGENWPVCAAVETCRLEAVGEGWSGIEYFWYHSVI